MEARTSIKKASELSLSPHTELSDSHHDAERECVYRRCQFAAHLEQLRRQMSDSPGARSVDDVIILPQDLCQAKVRELGRETDRY